MKLRTLAETWVCEECGLAWQAKQPFPAEVDPKEVFILAPAVCVRCEGAMKFRSRKTRTYYESEDKSNDSV